MKIHENPLDQFQKENDSLRAQLAESERKLAAERAEVQRLRGQLATAHQDRDTEAECGQSHLLRAVKAERELAAMRKDMRDITWTQFYGCFTGDCPHPRVHDCIKAIAEFHEDLAREFDRALAATEKEEQG